MKKKQWKLHAKKGWSMAVEIAEERDQLREDLKAVLDDRDDFKERLKSSMAEESYQRRGWSASEQRADALEVRCDELKAKVKELEAELGRLRRIAFDPPPVFPGYAVGDFPPWNGGWACTPHALARQN